MVQLVILAALSLVMIGVVNGLCAPEHVQSQFCNADYVVRVKVMSAVKHEVPELPPRPTSPLKPHTRPIKNGRNENKSKKKNIQGVAPVRRGKKPLAPAPFRFDRSIGSRRGIYRRHPLMGWRYQEIRIKRILKGVGRVEITRETQAQLRTNKTTRYSSRMYVSPSLHLIPGKTYILAGKIRANRLYVSSCNWNAEWDGVSVGQIRGLRKTFVKGCGKCSVKSCYQHGCENIKEKGFCKWKPEGYFPVDDCRYRHSSCRVHKGNCQWIDNDGYRKCMKKKADSLP